MTPEPVQAVFDCNIYAQGLINLNGPAARCIQKARDGFVSLFVSPFVLAEIRELYEKLPAKYGITAADTDDLARNVVSFATTIFDIPEVYRHPIDPDDSLYVNLALCASARLIVSRDRHLLNLMDQSRREGQDFRGHFPAMRILDPVELLRELDEQSAQEVN